MPTVVLRDRRTLAAQVIDEIRSMIRTGKLPPGERLPSEAEFAALYGVGRTTIREAVKALEHDRLIDVVPGRGRYVTKDTRVALSGNHPLSQFQSVTSLLQTLGYPTTTEVVAAGEQPASAAAAQALGIDAETTVVQVNRLRRAGEKVLVYSESSIRTDLLGVRFAEVDWTGSILAVLSANGLKLSYAVSEISAARLPAVAESLVGEAHREPWLLIEEVCLAEDGGPILFSRDYFLGPEFKFTVTRRGDGIKAG